MFPSSFVLLFGNNVWVRQVSPELSEKYIHAHLAWCLHSPPLWAFELKEKGGKSGREAGKTGETGSLCIPRLAEEVRGGG